MHELPLVTVICICHNQGMWVEATLESVLNQTYSAIELIIVDTGSSDNSVDLIKTWVGKKEVSHRFGEVPCLFLGAVGNCRGFNKGFALSGGKYVIDLAADDRLLPERIEMQVAFFESLPTEAGIIYGDATYFNTENKELYTAYGKGGRFEGLAKSGYLWQYNMKRFFICPQSTMFRSKTVQELGGYNDQLYYEDFDFYCRAMRQWSVHYHAINETAITVIPTSHGNSLSKRNWQFFNSTLQILAEQSQTAESVYELWLVVYRFLFSVKEFIRKGK